jgi:hypothetical protein
MVLVVVLTLSSMINGLASQPQISLSPTCGLPGTIVTVTGSGFTRQASSFCEIHSDPAGLVGPTRGTDFDCNINAQGEVTGPDGPAFFVVAAEASGSYSVTVYYGPSLEESSPVTFITSCGVHLPYSICVIQLGVEEPNGTVTWLLGYAYPGTPISECQSVTAVLGGDVLGRTLISHQFIMNGTSSDLHP